MERTFGRLKRKFHILHSEIRMLPGRVCKLNLACAILHNFAILQRDPMVDDHDVDEVDYEYDGELQDGMAVRNLICNTYC